MIPWTAARQGSLSITNSLVFLKLMSMELVMPTPNLGTAKGLRTLREFDFGDLWDLFAELPQVWGNRLLGGHNQNLV